VRRRSGRGGAGEVTEPAAEVGVVTAVGVEESAVVRGGSLDVRLKVDDESADERRSNARAADLGELAARRQCGAAAVVPQ